MSLISSSLYHWAIPLSPRPGNLSKDNNPFGTSSSNWANVSEVPVSTNSRITVFVPAPMPLIFLKSVISFNDRSSRSRAWAALRYADILKGFSPLISRRSEEHTSELQSRGHLVCRLLLEKKKELYKLLESTVSLTGLVWAIREAQSYLP